MYCPYICAKKVVKNKKSPKPKTTGPEDFTLFINPKAVYRFLCSGGTITICQSGRSSGSWISLLTAPSRVIPVVLFAVFVPRYSGGTTPDSHRVPSWLNLYIQVKHTWCMNTNKILNLSLSSI